MRQLVNNGQFHLSARILLPYFLFALATFGLYASSLHSYLLFHSLIEVLCVVILLTIFVLGWNVREFLDNHYILFLGISFLSSASFELIHMFAYKGFGVFPDDNANLATQLWIVSRYVFSLSFLIAPAFITRRLNIGATMTVVAVLTAFLFAALFSGVFPDCFIEGKGLTPFKIYSEYLIILIFFAALGLLIRKRTLFDSRILRMLIFSIVSAAAADIAFTQYLSVYGPANLVGHFFLFLSAVLIYRAIVVTGIKDPMAIIFRNLEQSKEQFRIIAETSVDLIFQLDGSGKVVFCSPAIGQYGYSVAEVLGTDFRVYIAPDDLELSASAFKRAIGGESIQGLKLGLLTAAGATIHAEINIAPLTVNGGVAGIQAISRDITARRIAEEKLQNFATQLQEANAALDDSRTAAIKLMQDAVEARTHVEKINKALQHEVTERRHAEEALRENNLRFRLATEATGVGVWEWNVMTNLIRWDSQMFRIYGIAPTTDGVGDYSEWRGAVFPEDLPTQEEILQDMVRRGGQSTREFRIRRREDGECRIIQAVYTVLTSDQGQIEWVVGTNLDITERKLAVEALQASETRYRDLAESIPAMLWSTDVEGVMTDHNRKWYEFTGQTLEQAHEKGWKAFIHPDDVPRVVAAWAHCRQTGEDYAIEYRIRRALDGAYRWHSVQAILRKDQHGAPLDWFGTCIDIEERKQAENALRESEERLKTVLQAGSIGTFEIDLQTGEGQWNSVEYELLGLQPGDVPSHPKYFFQYVHPDDIEALQATWADAIRFGELDTEFRILRANGQQRWLAGKGRFLREGKGENAASRFLGVNFDITDRKLFEEKLRESEALYRGIGESIDYGVWVCAPDGRNTYASESFLRMVGITQEQCSNFGWGNVLHPDDADRTIAAWQECVRTGGTWDIEHRFRGADGQWHHVLARGVPIRNAQGTVTQWVGINLDISRLKQAEEQIKASLAEKEVMLREIHHRVKNNLQVISSLINLQVEHQADEKVRSVFGDVRDRVRSIALVHEKLYQTGDLAQLNFAEYAESLLQYLWRSHGALAENIRLNLAIDPVELSIETAVPCGLILNELAGNALKHAFPRHGGQVAVSLEHDPVTAAVCLRVRDNGVGLPSDFDWQFSRSLGLRLVHILAGQLRGTVETGAGPGTEFIITFLLNGVQL